MESKINILCMEIKLGTQILFQGHSKWKISKENVQWNKPTEVLTIDSDEKSSKVLAISDFKIANYSVF